MRRKLFLLSSLLIGFLGFSQTEVTFKYDQAGNQIFRGTILILKPLSEDLLKSTSLASSPVMDENTFWEQIRLYPVPVKDLLTIDWSDEANELIESVSLYQHSSTHWKFQKQNIPELNKQLKINMSGFEWGVYVLHFTLKNGQKFSKNITKN